jgi:predicted ATPase
MIALSKLKIQNLLSFGERGVEVDLRPLNVLIGPNGSGKTNLIEVIGLLNSAPEEELAEPFRDTGGVAEWIWKGGPKGATAAVEATVNLSLPREGHAGREGGRVGSRYDALADLGFPPSRRSRNRRLSVAPLRYRLAFRVSNYRLEIVDERIEADALPSASVDQLSPEVFFAYENGRPTLSGRGKKEVLRPEEINPQESVLLRRRDLGRYPELTELGRLFAAFQFYRDWEFGIGAKAREASSADGRTDFLEESLRNFSVILSRLMATPEVKPNLLQHLRTFYADAEDIATPPVGGNIEVRLEERSKFSVSAKRLSDGTLRWLALLAILLNPTPPPLVCLEEPELGLHPDVIRPLAKLLIQASERMQLVVTTHSDTLVDELTETPEAVIVCEKDAGSTTLKRLGRKDLSRWLREYTLGELWHKGQIGGTRW